ncbi:MAG: hypothetical protein ACRCZ9_11125 [Fusobacteriaceae bacterium]
MKKILLFLGALAITTSALAYKIKPESLDTSKYHIPAYENQIKELKVNFDSLGKVFDSPSMGLYNFVELIKDGKLIGYVGLTHVKAYNKHEVLLVALDTTGKIIDMNLPEANAKHPELKDRKYRDTFVGKNLTDSPMDILAGSTFHAYSVNGEVKNILRAFEFSKDQLQGKK